MHRNRQTANLLTTILVLATLAATWIVYTYLPTSPQRLTLTFGCFAIGTLVAMAFYYVVTVLPEKRVVRITLVSIFGLLTSVPIVSTFVPRITYCRFGFTVFGAMPIPFLDITINQHGVLWFRPKTHQISRQELDSLITSEVEIVVVGIGWDSIAQLTDDAKELSTKVDLRVLPTPAAFTLYNKLKAEGRRVVLLAHSTC